MERPYLKDEAGLIDPWGRDFQYLADGKHNEGAYDMWSLGADGKEGTEDDINNGKMTAMKPSPFARLPRKRRGSRVSPLSVGTERPRGGSLRAPPVPARSSWAQQSGLHACGNPGHARRARALAGIEWPAMESQIRASELPESADRMRTVLAMTRCEAMMQYRRFRVRFETEAQQPIVEWERTPSADRASSR
jgi:hypothetical protein